MGRSLLHGGVLEPEILPTFQPEQADTVALVTCAVCTAPMHVFELKEHQEACWAIERLRPTGGAPEMN